MAVHRLYEACGVASLRFAVLLQGRSSNPEAVGNVLGWWNAEAKALGINQAKWEADPGWKRLETVAHEVMHAHQTLCHDDWKPGWDHYVKLAAESNDATVERGSEESGN